MIFLFDGSQLSRYSVGLEGYLGLLLEYTFVLFGEFGSLLNYLVPLYNNLIVGFGEPVDFSHHLPYLLLNLSYLYTQMLVLLLQCTVPHLKLLY